MNLEVLKGLAVVAVVVGGLLALGLVASKRFDELDAADLARVSAARREGYCLGVGGSLLADGGCAHVSDVVNVPEGVR
jgi:hypothetical protein